MFLIFFVCGMILMMNLRRDASLVFMFVIFVELLGHATIQGNVVFNVQHQYGGQKMANLSTLMAHDLHRHGRYLASLHLPVGGNGRFTGSGLYYSKLAIGTPQRDFHLQIDTGSDLMWVNCAGCNNCPSTSRFGFDLALFDMKASSSAKQVTCDADICVAINNNKPNANCTRNSCEFATSYYDGSESGGSILADKIKFDESSGDGQSKSMDTNIVFGCSSRKSGSSGTSTDSVDGIIGFGQAKYSIISQLAMSNDTKKMFAHCFDGKRGGGLFVIGQVIEPEVKDMIPLLVGQTHYTISTNAIDVGGKVFEVGKGLLGFVLGMQTVIDSGATLAYLPEEIYEEVMKGIMAGKPDLKPYTYENQFTCFAYNGDVDKDFPVVTFQFKNSISLKVYPHDYLVQTGPDDWCAGWQKSEIRPNGEDIILLGDLVLSNKLFVYDLEKQAIGWREHDCNKSVKVKDDGSGNAYTMNSKSLISPSSAYSRRNRANIFAFHLLMAALYYLFQ